MRLSRGRIVHVEHDHGGPWFRASPDALRRQEFARTSSIGCGDATSILIGRCPSTRFWFAPSSKSAAKFFHRVTGVLLERSSLLIALLRLAASSCFSSGSLSSSGFLFVPFSFHLLFDFDNAELATLVAFSAAATALRHSALRNFMVDLYSHLMTAFCLT